MKALQPVEILFVCQVLALLLITEFQLISLHAPVIAVDSSAIISQQFAVVYPKFIYLLRTYLLTGTPVLSPDPITVSGLFLCLGDEKMSAVVALAEIHIKLHCVKEDVPYVVGKIVKRKPRLYGSLGFVI